MFKQLYFYPNGRSSRKFYWLFGILPFFIIGLILFFSLANSKSNPYIVFFVLFIQLLALWPFLVMQIKRWHDINLTGWLSLLIFIPYLGFVVILVVGLIPGKSGENKYGQDPLGRKVIE